MLTELVARELEEHGVDGRDDACGARLVVEQRELAEVLAGARVLQDDGRLVGAGPGQEDLHRAREHDVHTRALVALVEDLLARLELSFRHAIAEGVEVLGGQRIEQRDLGEELGVEHGSGRARARLLRMFARPVALAQALERAPFVHVSFSSAAFA